MKPILITGGGGFLGAWVARVLAEQGLASRVFDRAPEPPRVFGEVADAAAAEWVPGDVTDGQAVTVAASGCGGIIHLAALLTPDCQRDPVRGANVNLIGTLNAFEAAKVHGIAHVAYASSAAVFGLDSGTHPAPITHYGAFKLAAEACARAYWLDAGISSVGLRPTIVYGAGRETGLTAGITLACREAVAGRPYTIGFSGKQGFVFARDAAAAFVAAATNPRSGAQAYSLVGQLADVSDVAAEIQAQVTGAQIKVSGAPVPMSADIVDTAHAALLAPMRPTPIAEGIAQTVAHYRGLAD